MIIPSTESTNCYPSKQINRGKHLYNLQVVRRRDTDQSVKQVEKLLNDRPVRKFNYKTPNQVLQEKIALIT